MTTTLPTARHATRCLYCSRFVTAGVTRCGRCGGRSVRIKGELAAAQPTVVQGDGRAYAGFAAASDAYIRVRRCALLVTLIAIFAAFACR